MILKNKKISASIKHILIKDNYYVLPGDIL